MKAVSIPRTVDDVNLDLILSSGMEHMTGCSSQYATMWRAFCEFMKEKYDASAWPPKELFTDDNVAKFLFSILTNRECH